MMIGIIMLADTIVWKNIQKKYSGKSVGSAQELMALRESQQLCWRALKLSDMVKLIAVKRKTGEDER